MLQSEVITTVKSTAPVLAEQGEDITRLFYQKLFANHPELQNVFNMANQAQGDQARALAESVFRYASHIDELEKLSPLVRRIAHKHASLAVAPEHYPIVGKYLLEAIGEHLDLAPGDPVIQAWGRAYEQLATIFVGAEAKIYDDNAEKPGGWRGFRPFRIVRIVPEAEGIKSFYLEPEDGGAIAGFEPGQYVGVKIEAQPGEYEEIRQYSLSAAPGEDFYRLTVKSEANHAAYPGRVSNHLHGVTEGDRVLLQPPTGDFVLRDSGRPLVLVAGGVGITPLLSMLLSRLSKQGGGDNITFIHCCRDPGHHIMAEELRRLSAQQGFDYKVAYELADGGDHRGYLDQALLQQWLPDRSADVYFCGPKPFMAALDGMLEAMGFPPEQRHYEIFGPSTRLN